MTKIAIMYRTAMMAQEKRSKSKNVTENTKFTKLIAGFNEGEHVIDKENNQNAYSVINT